MTKYRLILFKKFLLAPIFILGLYGISFGQTPNLDPSKKLNQYVLRSWSTEDGLTSESTNEMLQTDDGYIWIGTFTGLHRFDGKEFTVFTSQNSDLPSPNVLRIENGHEGEIWLGTLHGIITYKNGEFITPTGLEATRVMSIEDMLLSRDGKLWFSTKANRLFSYDGKQLQERTNEFNLNESTILTILEDRNGYIYFGTDDSKLFILSKDEQISTIELDPAINGINSLCVKDDLIHLGTGQGLYTWDGKEIAKSPILANQTINSLTVDDNSVLWMGTMNGIFRWQPELNRLDSLQERNGMPNNIVEDMIFDKDGNLWVGTYRNGIFFLSDGSIISFTENDGLASNIISGVTEIDKNTYLLANENGTLNLLKNDEISVFNSPIPIPSARLKHIFRDNKKRIWVSTYGGLILLDGPRSRRYSIVEDFPDNFVRLAYQDHKGRIWIGTKNAGLIRFDDSLDKWEQMTIEDGLASNYIMSIEENTNKDLIVATITGLTIIRDDKVLKTVTVKDGLPSNFMFSTYSTDSYIWIASNDGLSAYKEGKIVNFNTDDGMPSNIVYDVMADDQGNLWMPSENSILSVKISELEAAAEDSTKDINIKEYDKSYGMKNSHCLGAVLSFTDSNGRFWIPTLGGIVRLDPKKVKRPNFDPNLIIESITADGQKISIGNDVIIPPATNRLNIEFTAIEYLQTDIMDFRYKLKPFDEEWIITDERYGLYTNLSPGTYTFELQTGIDNEFKENGLSQVIIIKASWWQTIWAKVSFFVAFIGLSLIIYWIRLRALTSRNIRLEETVSERTNALELQKKELNSAIDQLKNAQEQMIQSDKMASLGILAAGVAHEINNPLNFIQGGVDGLEQTLKHNESIKKEEYETLLGAIKEGISRASTIVSSLNEFSHSADNKREPCDIHHLIDNCLTMIRYRLKHGIELIKEFTDEEVVVMGNNGKIHQAFLNIITNAIQAIDEKGHIKIKTYVEKNKVVIDFTDSGHGIKPEHLNKITEPFFSTKDPGKGTGLGLSITYSIISEHKGTLNYSSIWGKGTTARVTLPLLKST